MKKIYIAGPDVFEPHSLQIGQTYVAICQKHNFHGMYPLDNVINFAQEKQKIAEDIFLANAKLIQECDIVVANLNPFRGKEADSGTVWECGYAFGLGKKVYGYMQNSISYLEQFSQTQKREVDGMYVDNEGKMIEDFDYPINLMIACSVVEIIEGSFEDAIKKVSLDNA